MSPFLKGATASISWPIEAFTERNPYAAALFAVPV
jgi:hypothetical protein